MQYEVVIFNKNKESESFFQENIAFSPSLIYHLESIDKQQLILIKDISITNFQDEKSTLPNIYIYTR